MVQGKKYALVVLLAGFIILGPFAHAQSADASPPSMPGTVSASFSQPATINVSWGASTDNVGVAGYSLYRNGILLANTAGTSFTDIVPAGAYTYTVTAYDAAGNVSLQAGPTAPIYVVADVTPPSAPTWISLVPSTSSVALSWNGATDNVGVVGYYIYRNGNKLPIPSVITATSYTDTGLIPGNTFSYKVVAYDAAGNASYSTVMNVTTISDLTPPSVPSTLFVTVKSSTEIDVTWGAATDNVGIAGYYVYRNGSQVANVSGTVNSYKDTGLSPNTGYLYNVAAYDAAGNVSGQSFSVQGTTLAPDTSTPSTPFNLAARSVSVSEIDLSWAASADNVGVTGYYIYRDGSQIASTASTTFADTGLASSTSHAYSVAAYDAAGNISAQATIYNAWTLATNPVVVTSTVSAPNSSSPLPSQGAAAPTSAPASAPAAPAGSAVFTATLSFGTQNNSVKTLQSFLVQKGYLNAAPTGFFGSLTQKAVQQFQCDQNIVCSGGPTTTGWGMVGAKTRAALNSLEGGASATAGTNATTNAGAATSLQQMEAKLQALEAQLKALQGD